MRRRGRGRKRRASHGGGGAGAAAVLHHVGDAGDEEDTGDASSVVLISADEEDDEEDPEELEDEDTASDRNSAAAAGERPPRARRDDPDLAFDARRKRNAQRTKSDSPLAKDRQSRKRRKLQQDGDSGDEGRAGARDGQDGARTVCLSAADRDPRAELSTDSLAVSGFKGYRSARVTQGVTSGRWCCEFVVEKALESADVREAGHVRVGWGVSAARIDGPVGLCNGSYGFRDVDGSKVHLGWRTPYGKPFREGDVVGLIIELGTGRRPSSQATALPTAVVSGSERAETVTATAGENPAQTNCKGERPTDQAARVPESNPDGERGSEPLKGLASRGGGQSSDGAQLDKSWIRFVVNGEDQGVAFENLTAPDSKGYFATASVYQNARLRLVPGPDFRFPQHFDKLGARPLVELGHLKVNKTGEE